MRFFDKENPLTNYTKGGEYKVYLKEMKTVFAGVKKRMRKNGTIIVEISNTFGRNKPMTPLAWDVAREVSTLFFLEREFIYCHKNGTLTSSTANHSYCFVFKNK